MPKSELSRPNRTTTTNHSYATGTRTSLFGFRASDFLRISDFGLRISLLLLTSTLTIASAQDATNTPPPSVPADPTAAEALQGLRGNLQIDSKSSEFDLKSNTVVYFGSVRVEATNMLMLCEYLASAMPSQGGKIERVVAQTNVIIDLTDEKGQKLHATGEQAVYSYTTTPTQTNEIIELSGNPKLDNPQGTLVGDVITYDIRTGKVRATNQRMFVRQENPSSTNTPPAAPLTNAVPVSTNVPAEAKPQ